MAGIPPAALKAMQNPSGDSMKTAALLREYGRLSFVNPRGAEFSRLTLTPDDQKKQDQQQRMMQVVMSMMQQGRR